MRIDTMNDVNSYDDEQQQEFEDSPPKHKYPESTISPKLSQYKENEGDAIIEITASTQPEKVSTN